MSQKYGVIFQALLIAQFKPRTSTSKPLALVWEEGMEMNEKNNFRILFIFPILRVLMERMKNSFPYLGV